VPERDAAGVLRLFRLLRLVGIRQSLRAFADHHGSLGFTLRAQSAGQQAKGNRGASGLHTNARTGSAHVYWASVSDTS